MFLGSFECGIDKKGRMFLPKDFRRFINGDVVLTLIDGDTLMISDSADFTPSVIFSNVLLPPEKVELFLKYFILNSLVVKLDSQGRILIPASMLRKLNFSDKCKAVGNMDTILVLNREMQISNESAISAEVDEFVATKEGESFMKSLRMFN